MNNEYLLLADRTGTQLYTDTRANREIDSDDDEQWKDTKTNRKRGEADDDEPMLQELMRFGDGILEASEEPARSFRSKARDSDGHTQLDHFFVATVIFSPHGAYVGILAAEPKATRVAHAVGTLSGYTLPSNLTQKHEFGRGRLVLRTDRQHATESMAEVLAAHREGEETVLHHTDRAS